MDFHGEKAFSKSWTIAIEANASKRVDVVLEKEALGWLLPKEAVMVITSKNHPNYENIYYFRDQKDLRLAEPELTISINREASELTVSTTSLARMISIELEQEELVMNDNFFDLLPGES